MYSPPVPGKKQAIKQVAIYMLMTFSVLALVSILILIMLGYRLDRTDGTIEQGGLVQFNSTPGGANLTINGTQLSATTPAKTTLSPGKHLITMAQSGYKTWQKNVDVVSGHILWLSYARLIPVDRPVENIAVLPGVTSTMPSPDRRWYAMTTEQAVPEIKVATISSDNPEIKTLALPDTSYTVPIDATTSSFEISSWDPSSRYLLVEHKYDEKAEWLVVDTEAIDRTKNITTGFGVSLTKPQFSHTDSTQLYALVDGDIRRIDIEGATISAPIVRDVAEFSQYDRSTILYVTTIDEVTKARSVGYRQENTSEPRSIRTYSDDGVIPLHITAGKYYNKTYVAVAYGSSVEIITGSLPRSDSTDSLSLTAVATMSTPEPIDLLSNKTSGRFFVAQHENSYSVYDLELQKTTTTRIRGDSPLQDELQWLDGYNIWSSVDSQLRLYEFDGANQNDVMPIIPGQNPSLSPNGEFVYAPTVDDKGVFHLSRVRLILQ